MGQKKAKASAAQTNFKFDPAFLNRVRAFANAHPMKPSMTRLFQIAMLEYLDREEKRMAERK